MTLMDSLHMQFACVGKDRVEATMPVTPEVSQPFGFLHGGATIALLETAASRGAEERADLEHERPFGVEVQVRHRKSATTGTVRAVAMLECEGPSSVSGIKQFWNVAAYDDEGDVLTEGLIMVKVVPLARLAEKERERREAKGGASR